MWEKDMKYALLVNTYFSANESKSMLGCDPKRPLANILISAI